MSAPKLYLFVGYPGAGKTTVAQIISEHSDAVHIWADRERQQMFGQPNLNLEQIESFYDQLNAETQAYLAEGQDVIFDTNFNYRKDRDLLRDLADRDNAETILIWLTTPVEISRLRAVEDSFGKGTRVWGNMSIADFERLSNRLEAPTPDEHAIEINGTNIDEQQVIELLGLS